MMLNVAKLIAAVWIYTAVLSALFALVVVSFTRSGSALWPVLAIFLGGGLSGTLLAFFHEDLE